MTIRVCDTSRRPVCTLNEIFAVCETHMHYYLVVTSKIPRGFSMLEVSTIYNTKDPSNNHKAIKNPTEIVRCLISPQSEDSLQCSSQDKPGAVAIRNFSNQCSHSYMAPYTVFMLICFDYNSRCILQKPGPVWCCLICRV